MLRTVPGVVECALFRGGVCFWAIWSWCDFNSIWWCLLSRRITQITLIILRIYPFSNPTDFAWAWGISIQNAEKILYLLQYNTDWSSLRSHWKVLNEVFTICSVLFWHWSQDHRAYTTRKKCAGCRNELCIRGL